MLTGDIIKKSILSEMREFRGCNVSGFQKSHQTDIDNCQPSQFEQKKANCRSDGANVVKKRALIVGFSNNIQQSHLCSWLAGKGRNRRICTTCIFTEQAEEEGADGMRCGTRAGHTNN